MAPPLNPTSKVLKAYREPLPHVLTNVLFGKPTDMETAYKVMKREALAGIRLRCVGFGHRARLIGAARRAGTADRRSADLL
jgi:hypothetical protein